MPKTQPRPDTGEEVTERTAWEVRIDVADPDDVRRSVRICNGVRAWHDEGEREIYQVGSARVEIVESRTGATDWQLVVSGAKSGTVLDGAARLGYATHTLPLRARVDELGAR